jgi:pyridoxine 5-phosphate synthase
MVELGVNIDHVATLRQARRGIEPDPIWAAVEAELGGADAITVHLREDRRHISDRDVQLLPQTVQCKLNLELSISPEIVEIALLIGPAQATLVPERRAEITTEGGLDLTAGAERISDVVRRLKAAGIFVSAFIDPVERQVTTAAQQGFDAVELHTGAYANAGSRKQQDDELARLAVAAAAATQAGLRLHAGHGLNYQNVGPVARLDRVRELNIGHALVSRAIFVGLREAVAEMKRTIDRSLREASHV